MIAEKKAETVPDQAEYLAYSNVANPYTYQNKTGEAKPLPPMPDARIPNTDVINWYNENTKTWQQRRIRFIVGCPTIFEDEQITKGFPRDYKFSQADKLFMERGQSVIFPKVDPVKYEYFEACTYNQSNPNRDKKRPAIFYRNDVQKREKEQFDKDKEVNKAKGIVYALSNDELKLNSVAKKLGQDLNNTKEALINRITAIAEKDPQVVITAAEEHVGDITEVVFDALHYGVLEFQGVKYVLMPSGEKVYGWMGKKTEGDARRVLIEHLQSEEGQSQRQLIETLVKEKKAASE